MPVVVGASEPEFGDSASYEGVGGIPLDGSPRGSSVVVEDDDVRVGEERTEGEQRDKASRGSRAGRCGRSPCRGRGPGGRTL